MTDRPIRRVAVVGSSGSGKTTFARRLSDRLGVPHIELDALYWGPDWQPADDDTFRRRVAAAVAADAWVSDGNYSVIRPLVLDRVDTVVWLDLPLRTCFARVIRRTARRARTREELWPGTGNREGWRRVVTRDSLVWWVLTTHRRRRREYVKRFADPAYAHLRVHRFTSPAAADAWLETVARPATSPP